jgi:hypothetical protein
VLFSDTDGTVVDSSVCIPKREDKIEEGVVCRWFGLGLDGHCAVEGWRRRTAGAKRIGRDPEGLFGRPAVAGLFGHRRRVVLTGGHGNISKAIWLLFGAVLGVLLIACVNLSSLQLARSIAHDRTTYPAISGIAHGRPAACRYRRMRGNWFGVWGIHIFQAIAPANLLRLQQVAINRR